MSREVIVGPLHLAKHRPVQAILHPTLTSQVNTGLPFILDTYVKYMQVTAAGPLKGKTEVARYQAFTLDRKMLIHARLDFHGGQDSLLGRAGSVKFPAILRPYGWT